MLGVQIYGDQVAKPGAIVVRQRGTMFCSKTENVHLRERGVVAARVLENLGADQSIVQAQELPQKLREADLLSAKVTGLGPVELYSYRKKENVLNSHGAASHTRFRVDRWVPEGSRMSHLAEILERLKDADATEESVESCLAGWKYPLTTKDVCTTIRSQDWKKARFLFNWFKKNDYPISVVTYNVLLSVLRTGKQLRIAEEIAEEMIRESVNLDNYTYSTLISCASQCKCPDDALKWFDIMHSSGCVPDEVTVSSMILVYGSLGRFKEAGDLYRNLRLSGWIPDKVTYGTMVNVYAQAGMYQEASDMVREMKAKGYRPDAVIYNTLIRFFTREGKTGQAKRVYREMESMGIKPTEFTLSLMIDVYSRAGDVEEALKLFTRMKEERLPLDVVVYNSLLKMCGIERLSKEGLNLFEELKQSGLKPDEITYKSLMNTCAKEGRMDDAIHLLDEYIEAGYAPDVVIYSCLIKACGMARQFEKAEEFFKNLIDTCSVDDRCCGVLLSLLNMCVEEEDKVIVHRCLEKAKPSLSSTVDLMLTEHSDPGQLEKQIRTLLSDSSGDSHRPFCNLLIDICWNLGKSNLAQEVLSIADSLGVYAGGIESHSPSHWVLHLRSLSFSTAQCALQSWISSIRCRVELGEVLPANFVIETGAGRSRADEGPRLSSVILSRLEELKAPFEVSPDRVDWLVATGASVTSWLRLHPICVS